MIVDRQRRRRRRYAEATFRIPPPVLPRTRPKLNVPIALTSFVLSTLVALACEIQVQADDPPGQAPWVVGSLKPTWAAAKPIRTKRWAVDSDQNEEANGRALTREMQGLQPGDRLLIGPGRYAIGPKLTLNLRGTAKNPIRIEAADPDDPPVLTRDARQNLLNVGEGSRCEYLLLRGLELAGGSVGIRVHDVGHLWIDQCHIHDSEHGGLTANTHDSHELFITRNHFHGFHRGTAEGMYLGANHAKVVMRNSVIADNHVHDCRGEQGDGIELKQGSYDNWIVGNHVHDTRYPCIIVYGTGGRGINVVERNICYRSGDHVMQIQGEATVQNNLLMSGQGAGFASTDHQGKTVQLKFVHNTIINEGVGANLSSWDGRNGMVFANNAVYSRSATPVRFPGGRRDVQLVGNVIWPHDRSLREGARAGRGLSDFRDVSWDAEHRGAEPTVGSTLLGAGDPRFLTRTDISGKVRRTGTAVGAYASH